MKFRMGNIEFYPDKALTKEDFERLKTLLNTPSLTEDEERELTDLKRRGIKKHLQLVEAGIDSALSGQEPSPEVDELVETLEIE
jgi:hypothetical protein